MAIFARIATAMQALLRPLADQAAQHCGSIRRQRKFTGATLVQTFVLGYLRNPTASADDLASTAQQLGVDVSSQAIDRALPARFARLPAPIVAARGRPGCHGQATGCGLVAAIHR